MNDTAATAESASNTAVSLQSVTKRYGDFVALDNVSLDIRHNEFFTLLGPSGCGKTTLLRTIAGFESVQSGAIHLYGDNIVALPPNKRPVNTVFQQYALFPHMDVTANVIFGLQRLGVNRIDAEKRTAAMLELVQLTEFAKRMPSQLSGGQQQRVALARALAPNPKVLLLDEPLSALDLKLRQAVRLELQQIQHETGITFIFVTHDQEEALTMSDRIAVLSQGRVQQTGSAQEIYEAPQNRFVADFIGESNFIDVTVASVTGSSAQCILPGGPEVGCAAANAAVAGSGHLLVRPERVSLCSPGSGLLDGVVSRTIYLGTDIQVDITTANSAPIAVRIQNSAGNPVPASGETVGVTFDAAAARLLAD